MTNNQLSTKERQFTYDILKALSQIPHVTRAAERAIEIKWILKTLMGESPRAKKPYAFPDPFSNDAAIILQKVEADLSFEEVVQAENVQVRVSTQSLPPTNLLGLTRKRARSPAPIARRSGLRQLPDMNDPRLGGIMRGISLAEGAKHRSYTIFDKSIIVNANVAGHNGLEIGQWWPFRICALRDGAHGATMAGIAGGEQTGAFSIVVSNGYEGMDQDFGHKIHYSAPNSHSNTDPNNPIITQGAKALIRSRLMGRSVRVLRSASGAWKGAPSRGIRYDGLYSVARESLKCNSKGGAYLRFTLVRDGEQADIDKARPTGAEKRAFDRLGESV